VSLLTAHAMIDGDELVWAELASFERSFGFRNGCGLGAWRSLKFRFTELAYCTVKNVPLGSSSLFRLPRKASEGDSSIWVSTACFERYWHAMKS
jgi:hypothetical protein